MTKAHPASADGGRTADPREPVEGRRAPRVRHWQADCASLSPPQALARRASRISGGFASLSLTQALARSPLSLPLTQALARSPPSHHGRHWRADSASFSPPLASYQLPCEAATEGTSMISFGAAGVRTSVARGAHPAAHDGSA